MTRKLEPIFAWHFLTDDGTTGRNGLPVVVGQTMHVTGKLELCEHGLHFSLRALDALQYAPGARVQYVRIDGERILDTDKGVARRRTCLWQADATRTLHLFAIQCAEAALALIVNPDPRSLKALEIKRLWLDGKASDSELAAAWDAARDAARYAARDAARAAAWAAARAAARAAAWDAAWAAARAAARDAARAAARDAAWAAAWAAQNEQLETMLMALAPITLEASHDPQ